MTIEKRVFPISIKGVNLNKKEFKFYYNLMITEERPSQEDAKDIHLTLDENNQISNKRILDPLEYRAMECKGLPKGLTFQNGTITGEMVNRIKDLPKTSKKEFLIDIFKHLSLSIFVSPLFFILYLYIFFKLDTSKASIVEWFNIYITFSIPFVLLGLLASIIYFRARGIQGSYVIFTFCFLLANTLLFWCVGSKNDWNSIFDSKVLIFIILSLSLSIGLLISKLLNQIVISIYRWLFSSSGKPNDLDTIKYKLSFVNKLIIGFLSVIATIIGILLTIQQLLN